jgi:hypothetical protein
VVSPKTKVSKEAGKKHDLTHEKPVPGWQGIKPIQ